MMNTLPEVCCGILRARAKITSRFEGEIYHYLAPILCREILDVARYPAAAEGRLQASCKDNVIDYKRVVDALDEAGYSGYIGLEYVWIDWEHCNECDNLSETILYRDFFRGL